MRLLRVASERRMETIILEMIELGPGEKALVSLQLPSEFVIIFDPVTHSTQFLDVKGEPTTERQNLSMLISQGHRSNEALTLRPGPLRQPIEPEPPERVFAVTCFYVRSGYR